MNNKKKIKIERNAQGVRVRVCCSSCMRKEVGNDGSRLCRRTRLGVGQFCSCRRWKMSMNVGLDRGRVKRKDYLSFVFEIRMQEQEAILRGSLLAPQAVTTEVLRKQYEDLYGVSIYTIN